jgi:hypothetical protein
MSDSTSPAHGDVLITKVQAPRAGYDVQTIPSPPGLHYARYDDAVNHCRAFARGAEADVWYADGKGIELVARYRPEPSDRIGVRQQSEKQVASLAAGRSAPRERARKSRSG